MAKTREYIPHHKFPGMAKLSQYMPKHATISPNGLSEKPMKKIKRSSNWVKDAKIISNAADNFWKNGGCGEQNS